MTFHYRLFAHIAIAGFAAFSVVPAQAGLINPTSTVTPTFIWDQGTGPQIYTASNGQTSALPPFSLAAPYTAGDVPNVPYILAAQVYMLFGDTTITIVNAATAQGNAPFCFSSTSQAAACADVYDKFDFKFTNELITGATVDTAGSSAWNHWAGTEPNLLSANEFTIDVTGDFPPAGGSLVINLTFGAPPPPADAPEPASMAVLGVAAAGVFTARRRRPRG